MRLLIRFQLDKAAAIPIDHQHALMGFVYRLLATSSEEYAEFLHEAGYREPGESLKNCKLFTFSGLRVPAPRRRIENGQFHISPGPVEWLLASAQDEFLLHSATGLLSQGSSLDVYSAVLTIESVEALPTPEFKETTEFTCLTPIVATSTRADGTTAYIRPTEPAFSEAIRTNLLWKHTVLHGEPPKDDRLEVRFNERYLQDPRNRGGTKLINFKGIRMVGAFAPFTLTGSTELMKTAWDCGLGGKNGIGCGMVDVRG